MSTYHAPVKGLRMHRVAVEHWSKTKTTWMEVWTGVMVVDGRFFMKTTGKAVGKVIE